MTGARTCSPAWHRLLAPRAVGRFLAGDREWSGVGGGAVVQGRDVTVVASVFVVLGEP
ncbi:hypothetical protein MTP10_17215 [Nonomuraea sp. 3-1Str]|uniref:hypothetical protein n=1 Tax=Nonomuraea sp. 3-1Str TaxID=2929801 RepID=UPI002860B60A|nr:hypothetical protein [Nonomuraea sp. 3-1Str]MDR8410470.1 hypothetical protein [Nonomuraea sp. 3-1Str]